MNVGGYGTGDQPDATGKGQHDPRRQRDGPRTTQWGKVYVDRKEGAW